MHVGKGVVQEERTRVLRVCVDELDTVTGEVHRQISVVNGLLYHLLATIQKTHVRIWSSLVDLLLIAGPVVGKGNGQPAEVKASIQRQKVAISVVCTVDAQVPAGKNAASGAAGCCSASLLTVRGRCQETKRSECSS